MNVHLTAALRSAALLLLMVALALPAVANTPKPEDPFLARAFEVHYRSLTDAADLAGELLSPEGSLTIKPRLKTIVIEDYLSILRKVEALLESFDLPPKTVEVAMSLFMGRRSDEAQEISTSGRGQLSTEVRNVIEALRDFTQWTSYEPLGSRSVSGVEGDPVIANITGEYRVAFTVEAVHENQKVVKFERFSLQRLVPTEDGGQKIETLYTAGMVVDVGKLTTVVAASSPDSKQALFLALQVELR